MANMKTILITLALVLTLQSCKQESTPSKATKKSNVVLGAFNDMTTQSSFKEEALVGLPEVVNFSDKMTSVKQQAQRGTCTFFAATALVEAAIKIDLGIETNLSEEYMIYSTKNQGHYDDVEASHVSVNLQSLKTGGILLERDWSYMPTFFGEGKPCAGLDAESDATPIECFVHKPAKETLTKVIPAAAIKTGFIRKNTNEIIKFLANNQRPLTISLPVNFKGWSFNGSVVYNENLRQECLNNPSECGAHAVVLTGYNLAEKVFYFKNSWGDDWGQKGFGELSFEMVDRYVDGYLYYAKVDGDINLPADHDEDNLAIDSLEMQSSLSDDLNIDVNLKMINGTGRYIEIQHYLGAVYTDEDGEEGGVHPISVPYSARMNYGLSEYLTSFIVPSDEQKANGLVISSSISGIFLRLPGVKEEVEAPEARLVMMTAYFLQTDKAEEPVLIHQTLTNVNKL